MTGPDYTALRRRCADALQAEDQFGAPWVREVFEKVERERFAPARIRVSDPGGNGGQEVIDYATDARAWANAVYAPDRSLITQLDDGATLLEPGAPGRFTSSLSAPRVVVRQLCHLDLRPRHRVLHIGTGSGYDSALIAERTGARNLFTLEVDDRLAATARRNLDTAGYPDVQAVAGDGEQGWPAGAPYDRVLCTASANRVPRAWIEQTRPGGVILTPYRGLALPRLVVADDGKTASGPIVDAMSFMVLRGQRGTEAADLRPVVKATLSESERVRTDADLSPVKTELGAEFLYHVLVPGTRLVFGEETWWLEARDGSSWAAWKPDGRGRQWGTRRLLTEAAEALTAWKAAGAPGLTALGLTVDAGGDRVWAHEPDGPSWPVP
ncbi:methyltransferase domain-containing protein [Streptomyces hiroshimensis]|uniref:Protein-L-isoaspartate O-methyltransferase n=1 Tax=Streptomyces hiroshimensis TaxID=66424 RepID=A0ABQ2YPL8_9ACTN|nr:methyltransferase domain-containing protein [Streptomyces hiroshimensis]GGX90000.1 protein-L-isoaspartate O-methyltransferase [Streptomyces hiroshimensis]